MSVLFVALPIALILSLVAAVVFVYQVRAGQFDDLETPPRRMLFDDIEHQGRGQTGADPRVHGHGADRAESLDPGDIEQERAWSSTRNGST